MHQIPEGNNYDRNNRTGNFRNKQKSKRGRFGIGKALTISLIIAAVGFFLVDSGYAPEWFYRIRIEGIGRKSIFDSDTYESFDTDEDIDYTEAVDPDKDTGWVERDQNWYYLDEDHEPLTDQWIDNIYYVGSDGAMLRDTVTPDGQRVDKNGEVISMTGKAYRAYYTELKRLESKFGNTGIVSSEVSSQNEDQYKDMTGIGLIRLMDFNRDGLNEMLVAFYNPKDEKYHFRVYGYKKDSLEMYLDDVMGGNGNPMVYAVGTETLDAGEEYVIAHYGTSRHRIYGFNDENDFVKLKDIGLRKIDGKTTNDSEVTRVTESWISDNEKSYPMTLVKDYQERIKEIIAVKRTLLKGANATENSGSDIEKIPKDYPDKAREYTAQQLTEAIYEHTGEKIIDYLYDDFNGDGARDMVAMTMRFSPFQVEKGITTAPDEALNFSGFDEGYDYCATWWYTDGEETYPFYDFSASVMTGLRLFSVETDTGKQLVATMYWRDKLMPDYIPGSIINNGRTPYMIDAFGTTGRTTCTKSTGIIYRFSRDEGACELFNQEGYKFSVPSRNSVQYEHADYSVAEDGTTKEDCSYGCLRFDASNDIWNIF